jgi:hypothetical protein
VRRPIKIVSDFDGVWTDQAGEADTIREFLAAELARTSGEDLSRARLDVERLAAAMRAEPHAHGWAPEGRITAYVDEDPLCESSAICRHLAVADDARERSYRDAILAAGFADLGEFGDHCFHGGASLFRERHAAAIVAHARESLAAIHEVGAEVVIVSNSATEKLAAWFAIAQVDAGEGDGHAVRLRGSAAKWVIGGDETIDVGGRLVHVDRPRYREAIEAEQPDIVVGDVFSLDLALPYVMRRAAQPAAPRRLVLRRHDHTPAWILRDRAGGAIDEVVDGVGELVAIVRALRDAD